MLVWDGNSGNWRSLLLVMECVALSGCGSSGRDRAAQGSHVDSGVQAPGFPVSRVAGLYLIDAVDQPPRTFGYNVAINDDGVVLGNFCTDTATVLYTWTKYGGRNDRSPPTSMVCASDINNAGVYVAWANCHSCDRFRSTDTHGASNLSGSYAELPPPSGYAALAANGINDSNTIVGVAGAATVGRGWSYSDGQYTFVDGPGGAAFNPMAINDDGVIVGYAGTDSQITAAVYSAGVARSIGTLGGAQSAAHDVNNAGVVVGVSDVRSDAGEIQAHPFIYDAGDGGVMRDLGELPGFPQTSGDRINDGNLVVGWAYAPTSTAAFAWSETDGMVDLSTRLAGGDGWLLFGADGVNNHGQIVGRGWYDGAAAVVGFVLTPRW